MSTLSDYLLDIASIKGLWILGESSGTTAADSTAGAHDMTVSGSPTWGSTALCTSDATTSVLLASASSQYAQVADHADFDIGTGDWWMHALLKTSTNSVMWLLNKGDANGIEVWFDGDNFLCRGNGATITSAAHSTHAWRDGAAHQIICNVSRSTGSGQFYHDGDTSGSSAAVTTASNINNAGKMEIGTRLDTGNSASYWNGNLGYVAFGKGAALTTQQIEDLYSIFSTGSYSSGATMTDPMGMSGFFGS